MKFNLASGFFISIFCISSVAMELDPIAANPELVINIKKEMLKQFEVLPNLKSVYLLLGTLEEKDQQLTGLIFPISFNLLPEFLDIVYKNIEEYIEEYVDKENVKSPVYLPNTINYQLYIIGRLIGKCIIKSNKDLTGLNEDIDKLFKYKYFKIKSNKDLPGLHEDIDQLIKNEKKYKELLVQSLKGSFKRLFNVAKFNHKAYVVFAYNSLLSPSNKTSENQGKKFIYDLVQKYDDFEPIFSKKEIQKIKYIKYENCNPTASNTRKNIHRVLPR